jgi:hypothetical protein
MRTCRVAGSATGFTRVMRPVNVFGPYPLTVNDTGSPTLTCASCSAGTLASSRMLDGSTTVNIAVPGETTSPAFACRSLTTPAKGAVTRV